MDRLNDEPVLGVALGTVAITLLVAVTLIAIALAQAWDVAAW